MTKKQIEKELRSLERDQANSVAARSGALPMRARIIELRKLLASKEI